MNNMSIQQRRAKLAQQFELMIFDEQKLDQLETLFADLLQSQNYSLSDAQWNEVEERSAEYKSGKNPGSSWEDVKERIRSKNGL